MDYTTSDANVVDGTTGFRKHQDTAPVTTEVSAKDLNQVVWGLMKLLADAGISAATFDPATPASYSRISLAVQALAGGATGGFTGGNQSLANTGYQKLPGGLILQWGEYTSALTVAAGATTPTVVSFPLVFPTACFNVALTALNSGNDYVADSWPELVERAENAFQVVPQNAGGAGTDMTLHGFHWFAIGH